MLGQLKQALSRANKLSDEFSQDAGLCDPEKLMAHTAEITGLLAESLGWVSQLNSGICAVCKVKERENK